MAGGYFRTQGMSTRSQTVWSRSLRGVFFASFSESQWLGESEIFLVVFEG